MQYNFWHHNFFPKIFQMSIWLIEFFGWGGLLQNPSVKIISKVPTEIRTRDCPRPPAHRLQVHRRVAFHFFSSGRVFQSVRGHFKQIQVPPLFLSFIDFCNPRSKRNLCRDFLADTGSQAELTGVPTRLLSKFGFSWISIWDSIVVKLVDNDSINFGNLERPRGSMEIAAKATKAQSLYW